MLSNEDWILSHPRLLAIILGMCRRESGRNEINGVGSDVVDAFGPDVWAVPFRQLEWVPKC